MKKGSSKARVLKGLESKISIFRVPKLLFFDTATYMTSPDQIISEVQEFFCEKIIVVRSSASDEDGSQHTLAGEYDSVLNVPSTDHEAIQQAISTVITSYNRNGVLTGRDEVIVQEMVLNTSMSGVIFTHDLNTGAPYYVINYDDVSGLTDTVTSGGGEYSNRTLYIHRSALNSLRSERFQHLMAAIQELEKVMESQFLDVEFALGADFTPYLLQVRSITTQPNWNRTVSKRIDKTLRGIQSFVKQRMKPMANTYGATTVLGQMPDWNPAEMIGRAPRALAFSLYKTLITDHAWRIARKKMGYAVPEGQNLMVSLAGQPFIDARLSFHSYLPSNLPSEIGEKLVDKWVIQLKDNPELHDKIEFDVAITTYSFDIDTKMELLVGNALGLAEKNKFKELLRLQTHKFLSNSGEFCIDGALSKIEALSHKQNIMNGEPVAGDVSAIFTMVEDCVHLGTIPFSILARHGFIAKTILLSLNTRGILSMQDIHQIQSGVHTVASDLVSDMHNLQTGNLSHEAFMTQYGHLRPGTYDILSQRYDQMAEFGHNSGNLKYGNEHVDFTLTSAQLQKIDTMLVQEGFNDIDSQKLLQYIQAATASREYAKFIFTRTVSDLLEVIAAFGEQNNLSRDELSHIPLDNILDTVTSSHEKVVEKRLREISEEQAERHALGVAIRLPQVLFDEAGVHVVPFQVSHPNFITHKKVTGPCINLGPDISAPPLKGMIVVIENADPGFDWIFSQEIAGLITKYGGANSHMAIRCAEFGIPAAIGCGEQRYELFCNSNQLLLDCAAGLIKALH